MVSFMSDARLDELVLSLRATSSPNAA